MMMKIIVFIARLRILLMNLICINIHPLIHTHTHTHTHTHIHIHTWIARYKYFHVNSCLPVTNVEMSVLLV